jgi:hypothetical protein
MSKVAIAFIIGCIIGGSVGFLGRAMCHVAKVTDEQTKKYFDNL